jgi:hypothetical protein
MEMISLKQGMFDEIGPVDSIGVTLRLKVESMNE